MVLGGCTSRLTVAGDEYAGSGEELDMMATGCPDSRKVFESQELIGIQETKWKNMGAALWQEAIGRVASTMPVPNVSHHAPYRFEAGTPGPCTIPWNNTTLFPTTIRIIERLSNLEGFSRHKVIVK